MSWRSGEDSIPGPLPSFTASISFPYDATDHREGGNAATVCFGGTYRVVVLTSPLFMQGRNAWARQVKHLLQDIEWDNTDHAHGCQRQPLSTPL